MMLSLLVFLSGMVMALKMLALTVAENKVCALFRAPTEYLLNDVNSLIFFVLLFFQINKLYASITDNYQTIQDKNEREILIEYSERGRLFTILYTGKFILNILDLNLLCCNF